MASYVLLEQARHIAALVLDVDGILSDGFVTLTNTGDEIKSFDIRDGLGIKLVQQAGIKVIIITGRKSNVVEKWISDLNEDLDLHGLEDKGKELSEVNVQLNIDPKDYLYMFDVCINLSAFAIAGMKVTVPNGHVEVRRRADLVTQALGGRGAVREICDMLLMSKGVYQELLEKYTRAPY